MPVEKIKASKIKPIPVKIINETSAINPDSDKKWRAQDALRDLERAAEHKRDAALMKDVKLLAREKVKSLKDIC